MNTKLEKREDKGTQEECFFFFLQWTAADRLILTDHYVLSWAKNVGLNGYKEELHRQRQARSASALTSRTPHKAITLQQLVQQHRRKKNQWKRVTFPFWLWTWSVMSYTGAENIENIKPLCLTLPFCCDKRILLTNTHHLLWSYWAWKK